MSIESQSSRSSVTLSDVVGKLFPTGAVVAELSGPGDPALLFPAEQEFVKQAVAKRRCEFAAGRICARRALDEFGIYDFQLLSAPDRRPIWPASMVGSISHTDGYCVAAVAAASAIQALGVDSERVGTVARDLWPTLCGHAELTWCESLTEHDQHAAITLFFSAKEAFYKCQYPLTEEWLDFHDVRIEPLSFSTTGADFLVHLVRPLKIMRYLRGPVVGRYLIRNGLLTSGVALPSAALPAPAPRQ